MDLVTENSWADMTDDIETLPLPNFPVKPANAWGKPLTVDPSKIDKNPWVEVKPKTQEKQQEKPEEKLEEKLEDKTIKCGDCKKDFIWIGDEQLFYNSKGYAAPKRCRECRQTRKIMGKPNKGLRKKTINLD